MDWLKSITSKEEKLVIGLLSGTSMDGIDAALLKITGSGLSTRINLLHFETVKYSRTTRELLENLNEENSSLSKLSDLNFILGNEFSDVVLKVIEKNGYNKEDIDLIGSHGQTVFHNPPSDKKDTISSTLQLGESDVIADRTGVTTVGDFRSRDIAAGGQGAPLMAFVDYLLFVGLQQDTIAQNIGGIANSSFISKSFYDVIAFDSGPGNLLIDYTVSIITKGEKWLDFNAEISSTGKTNPELLAYLLDNPYFDKPPPKSTDKKLFGYKQANELYDFAKDKNIADKDILATLVEFTAETIVDSYKKFIFPNNYVEEIILSGGGANNPHLVETLKEKLGHSYKLSLSDKYGIPVDAKEAVGFAVLANETIHGRRSNVPCATGADNRVPLGKISIGTNKL